MKVGKIASLNIPDGLRNKNDKIQIINDMQA